MNELFAFEQSLAGFERRLIQHSICPLTMRGMTQSEVTAVLRECVNLAELSDTIYGTVQRVIPPKRAGDRPRTVTATETYVQAFERIFGEPFDLTISTKRRKAR